MAATTSISVRETPLVRALLARADDALILGHRLSEWTGRAPTLEEELALANVGLDLIGQARALYGYAAEVEGEGRTEDDYAYFREAPAFRNLLLVELPNGDFARTIARLVLYAAWMTPVWDAAAASSDATIAAIAARSVKESAYHLRYAGDWLARLGDGTDESHARAQAALDVLWPYTGEMSLDVAAEALLVAAGVLPDPAPLRPRWHATVARLAAEATLALPADGWMQTGGRDGRHTEHLGHLLAEMQSLARAHPGVTW